MPINSMDALIAALPGQHRRIYKVSATARAAGTWYSLWRVGGVPGPASTPPTGNGEIPTRTTAGAIPFTNPSGSNRLYLARFSAAMSQSNVLVLYDRLWHNSGFNANITTVQTIASPPTLTRPDATGEDVELWGEVYVATGTTASTFSVSYTNSGGVSGRTATYSKPGAALVAGEIFPFTLQSGDTGVRTVSSVQLSAATGAAGDFGLVLLRRIAELPINTANSGQDRDLFGIGMPEIYSDACLALLALCGGTTLGLSIGSIVLIEG